MESSSKCEHSQIPEKPPTWDEVPVVEDVDNDSKKVTRPRTVDDDTDFWSTYALAAGESDKQLLETWNKTLDSLLTFAALFSAINTAFIIESYKRLQPEPMDITNTLLRSLLRHRNDDISLSDTELGFDVWNSPASAIRINSTLFSSLACSILASFGAVLGKEMLAEYRNAVTLPAGASPEQARTRHRKFDGLDRFQFRLLMRLLPALLQLSLALFLVGIVDFMWLYNATVATVFMMLSIIGLMAYLVSLIIALHYEDSPFQTSLSTSLRLLSRSLRAFLRLLSHYFAPSLLMLRNVISDGGSAEAPSLSPDMEPSWRGLHSLVSRCQGTWKLVVKALGVFKTQLREIVYPQPGRMTWSDVMAALRPSPREGFYGKQFDRCHTREDVESTDCVVWLLKKGHDTDALRKVLKTFPLLPADILLKKQSKQNSELEPYASIYTSSLNRRPGDVDFRWDDPRKRSAITDAIIAGTALFHVLKSREEVIPSEAQALSFQVDPDLIDDIDDEDKAEKIDMSLLTVILCVQTQMGITRSTMELLKRLLERYRKSCNLNVSAGVPLIGSCSNESSTKPGSPRCPPPSADTTLQLAQSSNDCTIRSEFSLLATTELMPPAITLLLDAVIYSVSQAYALDPNYSVCRRFPNSCEKILELLEGILDARPYSITLTSHTAVALTAIQWYKCKDKLSEWQEFNGVKSEVLRSTWLAVDKRAAYFPNIVQAFNMVDCIRISEEANAVATSKSNPDVPKRGDSDATLRLYGKLLDITEHFMPKAMEVSEKSGTWEQWWTNAVQIVPGLLRFANQVSEKDVEASHRALRVIARLLPDDWTMEKTRSYIANKIIPPSLESLSPLHPEHGDTLFKLMASVLTPDCAVPTREAAAEIMGWTTLYPDVEKEICALINDPVKGKMYKQSIGVPSFLMAMWKKSDAMNLNLQGLDDGYFENYFSVFFKMDADEGSLASMVQLEAVVIALANASRFRYWSILPRADFKNAISADDGDGDAVGALLQLLDSILKRDPTGTLKRPTSFVDVEVVAPDSPSVTITKWKPESGRVKEGNVFEDEEINKIWCGEWLMIIWDIFSKTSRDFKDCNYFFREDVVTAVVECFFTAFNDENSKRLDISFPITTRFLKKATEIPHLSDATKSRAATATTLLSKTTEFQLSSVDS